MPAFVLYLLIPICLLFGYFSEQAAHAPLQNQVNVEELQTLLSRREREVLDLFNNGSFILNAAQGTFPIDTLRTYVQKPYTILIFRSPDTSLLFWSNNRAFPNKNDLIFKDTTTSTAYIIQGSRYLLLCREYAPLLDGQVRRYWLVGLVPIYEEYPLQNNYLRNRFANAPAHIAEALIPSEEPTTTALFNHLGESILYLKSQPDIVDRTWARISLISYLVGSGLLLFALYLWARRLVRGGRFWTGLGALVAGLVAFRALTFWLEFPHIARHFNLFSEPFTSLPHWWSNSLGEFLLEAAVILMLAIFVQREARYNHLRGWTERQVDLFGVAIYGALTAMILGLDMLLTDIVLDSPISFRFDTVAEIDGNSMLALSGIGVVVLGMFLIAYRGFQLFRKKGYAFKRRAWLFGWSQLGFLPLCWWGLRGDWVGMLGVMSMACIWVGLLSLFVRRRQISLAWLTVWVLYFSALVSFAFMRNSAAKDFDQRLDLARAVSDERDPQLEGRFAAIEQGILQDDFFQTYFASTLITRRQVVERMMYRYLDNNFFGRYDYNVSVFYPQGEPGEVRRREFERLMTILQKSKSTESPNLHFFSDFAGRHSYLARLPISKNGHLIGLIMVEFIPKQAFAPSNIYVEMLSLPKTRQERLYARFEYALYKRDRRVSTNSPDFPNSLPYDIKIPEIGAYSYLDINDVRHLLYRSPNESICIVRLARNGLWEGLTVFSYVFCFAVLLLLFVVAISWLGQRLVRMQLVQMRLEQSLRERIQRGIVLVSLLSFAAIAIITILYFQNEYNDYHRSNLARRISITAQTASFQVLHIKDSLGQTNLLRLPEAKRLAEMSKLDVNIYNLEGNLASSSEEAVFDRRLISRQMSPLALYKLRVEQAAQYIQQEQINDFRYLSAYVPLRSQDDEVVGYLNLPYDSEGANNVRARDVAAFLGALLNVYVLFLLLAGAIALFIARSVTSPLAVIAEKLNLVALDKKNEPLEWSVQDEIGELVSRYNRMIVQLEESTQELARSQRESAWRDMAKQVAHEIKNPLTPMKLNIQLLQKLFSMDPERAKSKIERIASQLIEQIDALAHIASEFSNFAKMPPAENELFCINDLVASVSGLFQDDADVHLEFSVPAQPLLVFADKNQVLRVLNNIVKNATQAIPDDRKGEIFVALYLQHPNVVIAVRDNGAGIPEDRKKDIFVPNFTTKSSGSGIGLAMCKNIIEQARGTITFESTEGQGTTFFIALPLAEMPA